MNLFGWLKKRRLEPSFIQTPRDWMDFADWDRYWLAVLANELWRQACMQTHQFTRTSLCHLQGLERRNGHRILLAGNGISPEPYGFLHAGCDVTVVEVSPVACRFVAELEVTPDVMVNMFTRFVTTVRPEGWRESVPSREKSLAFVAEEFRPGGSLSLVTADLFSYEPEQRFDAIFSRRAYQGLPPNYREEMARRFFRWLQPGGLALSCSRRKIRRTSSPCFTSTLWAGSLMGRPRCFAGLCLRPPSVEPDGRQS